MTARTYRVLDNVATGVSAEAALPNRVTVCWVKSGSCDVIHSDDRILSLAVGARLVIDGLPAGSKLTVIATADNTVMEWVG
jgi:hypothetical protein